MKPDPILTPKTILAESEHWLLMLHLEQHPYVGRAMAWARREDARSYLEMTDDETLELKNIIVPSWWDGMQAWRRSHEQPEAILENVAFFANTLEHLHAQLIPRSDQPVLIHGLEYVDPRPNANYAPYEKRPLSDEFFEVYRREVSRHVLETAPGLSTPTPSQLPYAHVSDDELLERVLREDGD